MNVLTAISTKDSAMMNVPIQLTTLATAIAFGLGPCRNSSAPIIIGIGPAQHADTPPSSARVQCGPLTEGLGPQIRPTSPNVTPWTLNPMSVHSILGWQLPIIEHKIGRHGGRPWERQRPLDKPHDDDEDEQEEDVIHKTGNIQRIAVSNVARKGSSHMP